MIACVDERISSSRSVQPTAWLHRVIKNGLRNGKSHLENGNYKMIKRAICARESKITTTLSFEKTFGEGY